MDMGSGKLFLNLLKRKSDVIKDMILFVKNVKQHWNRDIKYIRCNNSGENNKLKRVFDKKFPNIIFEFTARDTPQQNGRVERAIATVWSKVRSNMNAAGIEGHLKGKLWGEFFSTAVNLFNISVTIPGDKCKEEIWGGELPRYVRFLKPIGYVGVIKNTNKIKSKIEARGSMAILVGYSTQHADEVYRMLNLNTNKVVITRDVKWLNVIYKKI